MFSFTHASGHGVHSFPILGETTAMSRIHTNFQQRKKTFVLCYLEKQETKSKACLCVCLLVVFS